MTLLRAELLKLRRRPATYVVLIVVLVLLALAYLGVLLSSSDPEEGRIVADFVLRFPFAYTFIVTFVVGIGGLFSLAYGAAVSGADWGWGTLRLAIARGESRTRYMIAKFAAVAVMIALGLLVCFLVGLLLTLLVAGLGGFNTRFPGSSSSVVGLADLLARGALSLILLGSIGFAIASVLKSQLAGIGAGIALYFAQLFLIFVPGLREVLRYGPFEIAGSLLPRGSVPGGGGAQSFTGGLDSTTTLVFALIYLAIAVGIACLATERAEIRE